ncbi:MAG TPA: hypothetical protein DCX07_07735, partial [Phycisphaerales bacterium]|nr:hypothetical protein [Phycisphaerales bacterium]
FLGLCASGALAALAGAVWLIDYGSAPVPSQWVGDLRLPAAAAMAGGMLLGGRGRAMLAAVLLPPTMLLATVWWLNTVPIEIAGIPPQLVVLIALVLIAHLATARALSPKDGACVLAVVAMAVSVAGLLTAGWAARHSAWGAKVRLMATGVGLGGGAVLLLLLRKLTIRQKTAPPDEVDAP